MQFLKRHFEKIILSAVLVGLGAAAFWLQMAVTEAKSDMTTPTSGPPHEKAWAGVDLAPLRNSLKTLKDAPTFILTGDHNLFNPVTWKRKSDGTLIKILKSGRAALSVTDIRPLYFTIKFDGQMGEGYYLIAKHPLTPPVRWFANVGDKATPLKPYSIIGTNSAPNDPSTIVLQVRIPETSATAAVSAKDPYQQVEGYETDMKYSGSDGSTVFTRKRVGDILQFSGESWKIIAITSKTITVEDTRTQQRFEIEWKTGQ